MGETLAETRVEVQAHRAELQRTGERLEARVRHAVDIKGRFRENPALFIGLGLGTAFLVAGGPKRVARLLRRRLRPNASEQAYDALPSAMQAWVDAVAGGVGPKAGKAREAMVAEIQSWRRDQLKSRKARRELARAVVDGPPGPSRTAWKAAEAGLTLFSAALARKAIERFLSGGEPPAQAESAPTAPADSPGQREYSGFSTLAPPTSEAVSKS
ncbi:MAG TPA: hypothetical protein VEW45_09380 [Candidatus Dormibacteraeota bacterium]|nr:hypothetical protein [Candidatus Dormibacteraeota bacterium]